MRGISWDGVSDLVVGFPTATATCLSSPRTATASAPPRPIPAHRPRRPARPPRAGWQGPEELQHHPQDGPVAGCVVVGESDDVMLIENGGVIIRVPAGSINVYKRDVQGVIVMRIEDGNKLVSRSACPT